MNYQKIYDQLITRAKTRIPPEGYIEHHHIIPKCMNGLDIKSNIAILTPEEHFVAHALLVKIYPEHPGLITAVARMCKGKGRKRRKLYGWLRRRHAKYMKQFMKECQSGKNNSQYGTIWISNGIENRKIKKEAIIPDGWFKGRNRKKPKRKSKMIWVNNNIVNKYVKQDSNLPEGFKRGRIVKTYKEICKDGAIRYVFSGSNTRDCSPPPPPI